MFSKNSNYLCILLSLIIIYVTRFARKGLVYTPLRCTDFAIAHSYTNEQFKQCMCV